MIVVDVQLEHGCTLLESAFVTQTSIACSETAGEDVEAISVSNETMAASKEKEPTKPRPKRQEDPKRIHFVRHAQGWHQCGNHDKDPCLTPAGQQQPASWAKEMGRRAGRFDVVLVSPFRRCIETALFAFEETNKSGKKNTDKSRFVLCRHAREKYWHDAVNQWNPDDNLEKFLTTLATRKDLPLSRAVELLDLQGRDGGYLPGTGSVSEVRREEDAPTDEGASLEALRRELLARPEKNIAVVCHGGVIKHFCGFTNAQKPVENCEMIHTEMEADGKIVPGGTAAAERERRKPPAFTACRVPAPGGEKTH